MPLIHCAAARAEGDHPAVNLDAFFAAGSIVRGIDDRLQGVKVGRCKAGHVWLAHAGGIAGVAIPTDLHKDGVAVGITDSTGFARAGDPEQGVHLALAQVPRPPGVHPERAPLVSPGQAVEPKQEEGGKDCRFRMNQVHR